MLHSTELQRPCNAIFCAGPGGQLPYTIASIVCWRDQHSTFSFGLLWRTWERSSDDSVFIAEGHLHTRLSPVLCCPSQVDLTEQHRPLTSWIMHNRHTPYSTCLPLLPAVSAAAGLGCFFSVPRLFFSLKCHQNWNMIVWNWATVCFYSSAMCSFRVLQLLCALLVAVKRKQQLEDQKL